MGQLESIIIIYWSIINWNLKFVKVITDNSKNKVRYQFFYIFTMYKIVQMGVEVKLS